MQQHGSKYFFPQDTHAITIPGGRVKKSNFYFFSEHGYVEYQFKGNGAYSSIVANNLPAYHLPLTLRLQPKGQNSIFRNLVMLHIKLKRITNAATYMHTLCTCTHPRPLGWGQWSFFSKNSNVAYKIKGNVA